MEGQATPMQKNTRSKIQGSRRVFLVRKSSQEAITKKELASRSGSVEQMTNLLSAMPRQRASVSGKSGAAISAGGSLDKVSLDSRSEPRHVLRDIPPSGSSLHKSQGS